jgi:hypothetical protein
MRSIGNSCRLKNGRTIMGCDGRSGGIELRKSDFTVSINKRLLIDTANTF